MNYEEFDKHIERNGTFCTQWDYIKDRFGYEDLLPFSISDMDIACPTQVVKDIEQRVKHPIYGYSRWKHNDYLGAIQHWYKKRFDCDIKKEWICYSPSVMYSIAKIIQIHSQPNDGVLIFTPAYDSFYNVIENNNRIIIQSELKHTGGYYEIDFDDVICKARNARIMLLCNPHNPVGRVWKKEELAQLAKICEDYNLLLVSDDIHMDITYQERTFPIFNLNTTCKRIICSSPSKTFNTPSLGGSYIIIPDKKDYDMFEKITRYTEFVNSPSILGVLSTISAYEKCEQWVENLCAYLYENLQATKEYIDKEMPLLKFYIPEGCYFAWIDFSQLKVNDETMQYYLKEKGKVAIMSGCTYGAKQHLRFHVGCQKEKVKEGLKGIKVAYDAIMRDRI